VLLCIDGVLCPRLDGGGGYHQVRHEADGHDHRDEHAIVRDAVSDMFFLITGLSCWIILFTKLLLVFEGAKTVTVFLLVSTTLTKLNLSQGGVGQVDTTLTEALSVNTKLHKVYLSRPLSSIHWNRRHCNS